MDTTPTPPPPPPPPSAVGGRTDERWRRPLADLLDLVAVLATAGAVGAAVAFLLSWDSADDPWAGLAAALLGLGAAAVVALVGWVAVLVTIAIGRSTPGMRLARPSGPVRPLATAARHVALVTAAWATAGAAASLTEPPPMGPLGGAAATAVAAAVLVAAYGWWPVTTRVGIVVGALVAGGAVAGAVPDRAPYAWELHDTAVGDDVHVRWDRRYDEIVVQLGSDVVAIVTATPDCASRVVLDRYDVAADLEQPTCH